MNSNKKLHIYIYEIQIYIIICCHSMDDVYLVIYALCMYAHLLLPNARYFFCMYEIQFNRQDCEFNGNVCIRFQCVKCHK